MLVTKTVLAERVFAIYSTMDDGETWVATGQEFSNLQDAIEDCAERNTCMFTSRYIVVPMDKAKSSCTHAL